MIGKLLRIPYVFVLLNWAAVVGLWCQLSGRHDVWGPGGAVGSRRGRKTRPRRPGTI